jgi:hypothetical protein
MRSPENFNGRPIVSNLVLLPSAARTTTGTGDAIQLDGFEVLCFQLEVTAAATDAGDTLDVYVQTTVDGTTWLDAVHFTQVIGTGGAKRYVSKISASLAQAEYETGTALGAAAVRHLMGDQYRVRWAITDASTVNASFTFSVAANGT